jgi:hypothetical protein
MAGPEFIKLGMYIMAPKPISAYFINPFHRSVCLYIYPLTVARQRFSKHVPIHVPRNNTVEVFSLCPPMDRCNATWARWRHTTVGTQTGTWQLCNNIGSVFSVRSPCLSIISGMEYRLRGVQLAVRNSHGKCVVEVSLWRLSVWLKDLFTVRVL